MSERFDGLLTASDGLLAVGLVAAIIYLGCIVSPPALMDDVDAVQAQIARTMLDSGDWVTARLDGVAYLEKAPLIYWAIALSYLLFGVHDWAARVPIALSAIALSVVTAAFGNWAVTGRTWGDEREPSGQIVQAAGSPGSPTRQPRWGGRPAPAGLWAGLCLSTCLGLFLFTRVLIPDVMLTLTVSLAMWALLRALDDEETHPRLWAGILAASLGAGLLLKSLVGVLFPVAAGALYLALTRQLFVERTWSRLRPLNGLLIVAAIALPWHVLATIRNPPYFAFTLQSGPGHYHGFLWFYLINEQLLRFLNLRYPRDYNTVPRVYFWLLHFVWLFPWSVYLPTALKHATRAAGQAVRAARTHRAAQTQLLALCWIAFVLVFFTFSTTQEYYSMPCYPALALLIGGAMAEGGDGVRRGTRLLSVLAASGASVLILILLLVRNVRAPGDISTALSAHPGAYTLSLGHMQDLTIVSMAYLRIPLWVAFVACGIGLIGTVGKWMHRGAFWAAAVMMVLFCHAARLALVAFDPYLSSRPLAEALRRSPPGVLITDRHYYPFSSVYFYTNRAGLLLNGRVNNLEYGSNAPDAPSVFIDDDELARMWQRPGRCYLVLSRSAMARIEPLLDRERLNVVAESGGKLMLTNQVVAHASAPGDGEQGRPAP